MKRSAALTGSLWALDPNLTRPLAVPEGFRAAAERLADHLAAGEPLAQIPAVDPTTTLGDVAVIDVSGVLLQQPSIWRWFGFSNAPTIGEIQRAVDRAREAASVRAIVLRVASPGGEIFGIPELAKSVARAAAEKPVVAHTAEHCASAAYWVAAQAREISCGPVAHVGSIGVFAIVVDASVQAEMFGLEFHRIATSPLKGAGYPGTEVSKELIAAIQEEIDECGRVFIADVARGRDVDVGEVPADGLCAVGERALAKGLVDRLADFEEVVAELTGDNGDRARRLRQAAVG